MKSDITRLRIEYAHRAERLIGSNIYSPFNPSHLFMLQSRQRQILSLLKRQSCASLADSNLLEIGCGAGSVLHEFLGYGVAPENLHGAELLPDRLVRAHQFLPHLPLTTADGQTLPYPSASFDLLLQFTVFTSILDNQIKANLAQEMLRVLHPDGLILWYDFWLNPTNPQTRGIRPAEIRRLFPGCRFDFRRITLAPPLARRLVPVSWLLCAFLEKLSIFNSHYLVAIRKQEA